VASLKQKKFRDKADLFISEGVRLVKEAVASQWDIEACLYTKEVMINEEAEKILAVLKGRGCRLVCVSPVIYNKITDTEHGQGLMVTVRKKRYQLDDLMKTSSDNQVIVVLDGLQDPGNIGTIIRTADAVGCVGVLLTQDCADLFSGKTIRATMGSIFHIPIIQEVTKSVIVDFFHRNNFKLFATSLESSEIYCETDFTKNVAVIFGNEGHGVSKELLESAEKKLHIPIYGQAESLNVAISAAIILYEAARQQHLNL
jgi:TrmH family RNA methyltransferase